MSVEENKAAVRRFFKEVFNEKQPVLIKELVTDEVVDHNKIVFTEPDAPGGVAEGVRMLLIAFPGLETNVMHQVGEGDYVSVHLTM